MPKMGESVNEGTIIKWHKKVGDSVKQDEIIFEKVKIFESYYK
jgi:2-oxoglutarate dehydrogenase E2 component (dihydrolipoamide succinyltransferase)